MGLLDTEFGKRRLLSVEVPAIEKYNDGRDPGFKIALARVGGALVLSYQLKPAHNKTGTSPAQLATHMFAVCQGALLSARMSGRREDFEDAVAPLMAQLKLPPLP